MNESTNIVVDSMLLRQLISTLDFHAFSKFVLNLWQANESNPTVWFNEPRVLPKIGDGVFEQHITQIEDDSKFATYNFVIPNIFPIQLFNAIRNINAIKNNIKEILERCKRRIDRRAKHWYFPQDGEYLIPNIVLATNISSVEKSVYEDVLLPGLQDIIDNVGMLGRAHIGSCDSFLELDPIKTINCFQKFYSKYASQISICVDEIVSIEEFQSDNFLCTGVLRDSKNPCESLSINRTKSKSDIITEFENLLNKTSSERELELFLKKYYRHIFGTNYDRIETQLWLRCPSADIGNQNRRIDLFLRNSVERDWEIFEIKRAINPIRHYRGVPMFKSEILGALQQLKNYKHLLMQDEVKRKLASDGIEYYVPSLRLVVGKRPALDVKQWRQLKCDNENEIKILTYDDLINEMRLRYDLLAVRDNYSNK